MKNLLFVLVVFGCLCLAFVNYNSTSQFDAAQIAAPATSSVATLDNVGRGVFDLTSPKFQCQDFLNSLNGVQNINIAFLYNTFGNNFDCLKTLLSDPRLKILEINLINEPCHRNHRCGKYEFLAGINTPTRYNNLLKQKNARLKQKFDAYVYRLQDLLASYMQPQTECLINFGLESNVSPQAGRVLNAWAKEAFPQCQTVWNPAKPLAAGDLKITKADYAEQHSASPGVSPPCIANLDGTDIRGIAGRSDAGIDMNNSVEYSTLLDTFIKPYAYCKVVFLWGHEDNGWKSAGEGWKDPRAREFIPGKFNRVMGKLIEKAETLPNPYGKLTTVWSDEENLSLQGCKKFLPLNDGDKKGFLWKQSDAHPGIVVLTTVGEKKVKTLALYSKGKKIINFTKVGVFLEDNYKNRTLWRTNDAEKRSIYKVPFHVVLKDDSGAYCRKINIPQVRQD